MSEITESVQQTIAAFRQRRLGILWDDNAQSGRAVLVAPAQNISTTEVNEFLSLSGGLTFVAISARRAAAFMLSRMSRPSLHPACTSQASGSLEAQISICTSVEAREGVSTGISAADRAVTIAILGEDAPNPRKLVQPGHIFPVQVRAGGVLVKNALPEGACDMVSIAGFTDAAVCIDLLDPTGNFLAPPEHAQFATQHGLSRISLGELTRYRLSTESLVQRVAEARLPTQLAGELRSLIYKSTIHEGEHLALIKGEIDPDEPVLTRVQAESTFEDVFGGRANGPRDSLQQAMKLIGERGSGVLVYLRRQSCGELIDQIESAARGSGERSNIMMRDYGLGAQILRDLGVRKVELLTRSKKNLIGIKPFGIEIVSQRDLPMEQ